MMPMMPPPYRGPIIEFSMFKNENLSVPLTSPKP